MNQVITIQYIDALYFTEKKLDYNNFVIHRAIGKLISFNDHITISFIEKNKLPEKGLLLPKEALILEKRSNKFNQELENLSSKVGIDIGIYWKDIVYFIKGKVPDECTNMYSEGILFSTTPDAVIVKNPGTIMVKKKIGNHPKEKTTFIVIPKSFITNVELYDKKL